MAWATGKRPVSVFVAPFLLLSCFWQQQSSLSNDQCTLEIQRLIEKSPRLTALLEEAKKAEPDQIRFSQLSPGSPNTGLTTYKDGSIEVTVECGGPEETTESLLAHELFHIILRRQGFPFAVGALKTGSGWEDRVLRQVGVVLLSCYSDPLIDDLIAQRGFSPRLTTRQKLPALKAQARSSEPNPITKHELWRKYAVLDSYCFSLRQRDDPMSEIFDAYKGHYPSAERDTEELARRVGRTRCEEAQTCVELTKKLRDAAGFKSVVLIENPFSGKLE